MTLRRSAAIIASSVLVLGAALLLLWSVVTTSTAQLSASTSGSGSFSAGTVELDQPETSVALLFDADGLYPGRQVRSCVSIAYEGSVPADIRLHAAWSGGTGLEEHVELRLVQATDGTCSEDGATSIDGPAEDSIDDPAAEAADQADQADQAGQAGQADQTEPAELAAAIERVAQLENRPGLSFTELLRCQNLRGYAVAGGFSAAEADDLPQEVS
ncbi:MAG: hypothetical protein AAFO29_01410 [Actinomycetota bacterium]